MHCLTFLVADHFKMFSLKPCVWQCVICCAEGTDVRVILHLWILNVLLIQPSGSKLIAYWHFWIPTLLLTLQINIFMTEYILYVFNILCRFRFVAEPKKGGIEGKKRITRGKWERYLSESWGCGTLFSLKLQCATGLHRQKLGSR